MTTFAIPDMSCGHCVASITRAVQALDPAAQVAVDLAAHRVTVSQGSASAAALADAIAEAGYTPSLQATSQPVAAPAARASGGGGCGCGGGRCHA